MNRKKTKKQKKSVTFYSFTLIELLTVVGIVSLMFAFVISFIDPAAQLRKGRDGVRKSDLRQIQAALEMYRADKGAYPADLSDALALNCPESGSTSFGDPNNCDIIYLQKIPKDPKTSSNYGYKSSGVSNYCLRACLENINDGQKDSTSDIDCQGYIFSTNCGSSKRSYTLQNP